MSLSPLSKFITPAVALFILTACGGGETSSSNTNEPTVDTPSSQQEVAATTEPTPKPAEPNTELSADEALLKRGKIVWFKCRSCHETSPEGPHKVGPNLNDLMGATAGVKEGFVFSDAMINSGVVWDDQTLDEFIKRPASFIKGTKMAFVGVAKEYDRQAVIAYIKENTKPAE